MSIKKTRPPVLCLVSSSGGHYEQLRMLQALENKYNVFWVTEQTGYTVKADYFMLQTGLTDKWFPLKMLRNFFRCVKIWLREKPCAVITTGTMVALPFCLLAKLTRKKFIYIESFARVHDGTKAGKLMYKCADLFIYQWESLKEVYPKGIYGGSIY